MTVRELHDLLQSGESVFLLDVRQPHEYQIAHLDGHLIPLGELPARLDELAPHRDEQIVVYCRSGARSGQAVQFLRAHGYAGAVNLDGGILAWSREIDPSMPTY